MGKNKLSRFKELETLDRVIQPPFEEVYGKDYRLKGQWRSQVFGNTRPLVLELGCGKGEYTVGMARKNPDKNFMGLDIKGARIWKGARTAHEEGLDNVAFLRTRVDFITSFFEAGEVDELWITFPDPQEKRRRRKKRLTGAIFLNLYRQVLRDGGRVHLKTDNLPLYSYTLELAGHNGLTVVKHSPDLYSESWKDESVEIQTFYESRFREAGARICYLQLILPSGQEIRELPQEVEDRIYGGE